MSSRVAVPPTKVHLSCESGNEAMVQRLLQDRCKPARPTASILFTTAAEASVALVVIEKNNRIPEGVEKRITPLAGVHV